MRLAAFAVIGLAAASATAPAQTVGNTNWPPPGGSRVRLEAATLGVRQTGSLISASDDSVVFVPNDAAMRVGVRTSDISRMEVVSGSHRNIGKGALIGFVVAGGTAALITTATWEPTAGFDFGRGGDAALVGGVFGVIGAVVGGIIGSHSTETWVPVSIPRR